MHKESLHLKAIRIPLERGQEPRLLRDTSRAFHLGNWSKADKTQFHL